MQQASGTENLDNNEIAWRGIRACRRGAHQEGLKYLKLAANAAGREGGVLPGLAYSHMGYSLALCEGNKREAVALCRHSIKVEFFRPENYLNLARTYLLLGNRRGAVRAVDQGLTVDPADEGLQRLQHDLGLRRPPVLSFLSRSNPLNRLLGRIRHSLRPPRDPV